MTKSWKDKFGTGPQPDVFDTKLFVEETLPVFSKVPALTETQRESQQDYNLAVESEKGLANSLILAALGATHIGTYKTDDFLAEKKATLAYAYRKIEPLHSDPSKKTREEEFIINATEAIATKVKNGTFSRDTFERSELPALSNASKAGTDYLSVTKPAYKAEKNLIEIMALNPDNYSKTDLYLQGRNGLQEAYLKTGIAADETAAKELTADFANKVGNGVEWAATRARKQGI